MTRRLNIGCGFRRRDGWVNLDQRASAGVIAHDLRTPLPFPDGSFDVVYHSHALEHLSREDGERLLGECFRVLAPGGVLRVVVPDLEQIARAYLAALDQAARAASAHTAANLEWMTIELIDQLARHRADGEMARYVARPELINAEFVASRWGAEGRGLIAARRPAAAGLPDEASAKSGLVARVVEWLRNTRWGVGRYRLSGDVHRWMYDRVSLAALLARGGFADVRERRPDESAIPDWTSWHLDTEPDGSVYRPNSLFIEARKP